MRTAAVAGASAGGAGELAVVRHELENALSAASYQLELLSGDSAREAFSSTVEAIRDALDQARGLSRRLDAGRSAGPATIAETEVAACVRQCVRMARAAVERRGSLRADLPARAGHVALDACELREVALNLLLNAAAALGERGCVRVSVRASSSGREVVLAVEDDGIGMGGETLRHACERGFTTRRDGSGIGLWRVRELVQRAGGELRVHSHVGRGTRVEVALPRISGPAGA